MLPSDNFLEKAHLLLASVKGKIASLEELHEKAIDLAALMLKEAQKILTPREKQVQEQLARLMKDPSGKYFTTQITDQCFRSQNNKRIADQFSYLLSKFGIPKFLSLDKRLELKLLSAMGKHISPLFVPLIKRLLRQETATVILPGESSALQAHLAKRKKEKVRVNLNHLGEAILGEEEALKRLHIYLEDLANPAIEYISIKISTLYSQLNLLAEEETLDILSERLRKLYRAAKENMYVLPDGTARPKFVNLDMEEYRDLHLTINLFCRVLSEPEFLNFSAGIVLQAYLPDSFLMQQQLTSWALERANRGGAPIKIRLVKGANLAMEKVEAALHGWPQAPFASKAEVDANFKRMLEFGCLPIRAKAVHLGIGSHNLFDIALGMLIRSQNNIEPYIGFEMLEGMADHLRRTVQAITGEMLLYCPVAKREEFQYAVAYLVRRLDENTSPENFLHSLFGLQEGSTEWKQQAQLFADSCKAALQKPCLPRRQQNRHLPPLPLGAYAAFENEPDTDWSLPENVAWARNLKNQWQSKEPLSVPLVINGQLVDKSIFGKIGKGIDPSSPQQELFTFSLADEQDIEAALNASQEAFKSWSKISVTERSDLLAKVAQKLREQRENLIGAMVANTGKTISEADSEVSEAVDFAEYYRRNLEELCFFDDLNWSAKGTVLVAPPWNFPCSIPCGGVLAALATGNCVLLKPAQEAILVGWTLANIFWEAGVSRHVLQFIACEDEPTGSQLVKDPRVALIVLTGGTATAKLFMKMRPGLDLLAETGGKNSMIITNLADRDLAIKTLLHSAFSYAGQKCSACSLAILEAEVYDDEDFLQQLKDAASSLVVGGAWDFNTRVNPLIKVPQPDSSLYRGLTQLEEGETWLLEPRQFPDNPKLWSPGIKLGVKENSFTHQNELFGPVLGLMRAGSLSEALKMANSTPYGLTAGLQSLDEREQQLWRKEIVAGNCYINRSITGAIVQRQPFGGYKDSSFGNGFKAGGANYLIPFMKVHQRNIPKERGSVNEGVRKLFPLVQTFSFSDEEVDRWEASIGNYAFYWDNYFSNTSDPALLLGQDNLVSYQAKKQLLLRLNSHDSPFDLLLALAAALTVQCPLQISGEGDLMKKILAFDQWPKDLLTTVEESGEQFLERLKGLKAKNFRFFSEPGAALREALAGIAANVKVSAMLANGRIELLNFLNELSLSIDYHRYGNLGEREGEKRKRVL